MPVMSRTPCTLGWIDTCKLAVWRELPPSPHSLSALFGCRLERCLLRLVDRGKETRRHPECPRCRGDISGGESTGVAAADMSDPCSSCSSGWRNVGETKASKQSSTWSAVHSSVLHIVHTLPSSSAPGQSWAEGRDRLPSTDASVDRSRRETAQFALRWARAWREA